MYIIQRSLEAIRFLNGQITGYATRIHGELRHYQSNLAILMSIPGIGFTIGAVLIAEIGDISQLSSPKQLVSWARLAPAVHESAGKPIMGISPSAAQNTSERLSSERPR
jgi:transposase